MDAATFGNRLRTLLAELMRPTWNPVMTTAAETPISKVLLPINNYFGFITDQALYSLINFFKRIALYTTLNSSWNKPSQKGSSKLQPEDALWRNILWKEFLFACKLASTHPNSAAPSNRLPPVKRINTRAAGVEARNGLHINYCSSISCCRASEVSCPVKE